MAADDREKLQRERAGTYRSADGRFTIEQSSSGWLLLDGEQANELGLPLARGPFATLDAARASIADARSGADPAVRPRTIRATPPSRPSGAKSQKPRQAAAAGPTPRPARPPIVIRELRAIDGDQLRSLWQEAGFRSLGDDDLALARMARRNPGLLLVAAEGARVVGSALGAWDGRRGWIYHVATAASHRGQGIATRLVERVETGLRDLGCPKVSVLVRDENDDGRAFWRARGYAEGSRQFARELGAE